MEALRMGWRRFYRLMLFVAVCQNWSTPLKGQTAVGSIVGTITDPSSAVVPNVKVAITNAATKTAREAVSNDVGEYVVPYPTFPSEDFAQFACQCRPVQ